MNARASTSVSAFEAERLRVDSLENPIGLGDPKPEFSWKLKAIDIHSHNLSQSAYEISVASSRALLSVGKPDLWDSGRVTSQDFLNIPYKGVPLASRTTYFWSVRVWDQVGKQSAWSPAASWTTALLSPQDWMAKWIAAQPDDLASVPGNTGTSQLKSETSPLPIFRREFKATREIKQALVFVTGLGQYEVTLNGKDITKTQLNPGWTDYRKRVLYQTYDVTSLLHREDNCIGVMLGNGMYNVPGVKDRYTKFTGSFGQPKLILQLHLSFADGSSAVIVSDKSWKTSPGPITFSSIYGGEDFDGRKDPDGWRMSGFKDASWSNAVEVPGPGNGGLSSATLSASIIPPFEQVGELKAVKVTKPKAGVLIYDFGKNIAGWPKISISGHTGDVATMTPAELLDENGMATQESAYAFPDAPVLFKYTLKGTPQGEVWHPRFTYYGFRYVQVKLSRQSDSEQDLPSLISISAKEVHDDVERTGSFSSQTPLLNQIHELIDAAILNNLASVLTDCPTREKLGWLEQTHLMGTAIMENFDVSGLYRKTGNDMSDSQRPDGMVPAIAPEFVAFVNDDGSNTAFRDTPEWGSAVILSPWAAYQFYGERRLLSDHYESMRRYAAYLGRKAKDHILAYGLGDWYDIGPNAPGESQLTTKGLTATAIYFQDLLTLSQIAKVLGKDEDARAYRGESEQVRDAFNARYFHPASNEYDRGSQTADSMPLALGLVPEDKRAGVLESLVRDIRKHKNHVTAGDIGFHYVVRTLTDGGRSDVLYDMLTNRESPSYGYQLSQGATALTEAWDANPKSSQDHFMLGHAEEWFYRGLAGINIDMSQPEASRMILRPALLREAGAGSASIDSVLGIVRSSWKWTDSDRWVLEVAIPPGAAATIYLPGLAPKIIGSGEYQFEGSEPSSLPKSLSH